MKPKSKTAQLWIKTPTANLYRYGPTGKYYMRARILGEDVKRSLGTKSAEIAKIKLKDLHEKESKRIAKVRIVGGKEGTVGALINSYLLTDEASHEIKQRTKDHHNDYAICIRATWKDINDLPAADLTKEACEAWAHKLRGKYSAPHYNGTIGVMRAILNQAVETGIRLDNPAAKLKRAPVRQKQLQLPSHEAFAQILKHLDAIPERREAAIVVRVLAYTGMRIDEASKLTPEMIDWPKNEIDLPDWVVKGRKGKEKGRRIPIIADLKPLLVAQLADYKAAGRTGPLLPIRDPSKSLETCCKLAGVPKIVNHDLRHLFATRCLESGVDVRTVAAWCGHVDGGALLLKTYAHLRNEHSQNMARLVKFG